MEDITDNTLERPRLLLSIPDLGGEDWDLMFADPDRVAEFCDIYERTSLTATEKTALMELIVASYDRHLSQATTTDTVEPRIVTLLDQDFALHRHTIIYWSRLTAHNPDSLWPVSPLMRQLLQQHDRGARHGVS